MKPKVYKSRVYDMWMCNVWGSAGGYLSWQDAIAYALRAADLMRPQQEPSPC